MKKTTTKVTGPIASDYVSFEGVSRRLSRDKKVQKIYAATRFEHEITVALIKKRIEQKLSQAQVAKKAGMHQPAIARLESGNSSPTLETVSRVAAALKIKVKVS
jgi:DNA-binding phage protein